MAKLGPRILQTDRASIQPGRPIQRLRGFKKLWPDCFPGTQLVDLMSILRAQPCSARTGGAAAPGPPDSGGLPPGPNAVGVGAGWSPTDKGGGQQPPKGVYICRIRMGPGSRIDPGSTPDRPRIRPRILNKSGKVGKLRGYTAGPPIQKSRPVHVASEPATQSE